MPHRPAVITLLVSAALLWTPHDAAAQGTGATLNITRNVEYAKVGDVSLKLDLYIPVYENDKRQKPPQLVVWIHGGGWRAGSKNHCPLAVLTGHDYAVASISYRLSNVAKFPAQIHDCKGAIRWLRANAKKYGYDAKRIGVSGGSAGGHLVSLLGTSAGVKELEGNVGGNSDYSSAVQAVVNFYGPTDFAAFIKANPSMAKPSSPVSLLLGGTVEEKQKLAAQASPATHVGKNDAPHLLIHGDSDRLVPPSQSELLHKLYQEAKLDSTLHIIEGAAHGGRSFHDAKRRAMVRAFFDKHLRK